jgi:citrate lyase subunit beta/citryl-CoA lyase
MTTALGSDRSWLFVPGNRPDRFQRAAQSGADVVILDLEDAVSETAKPAAREATTQWLEAATSGHALGCVRVNAGSTLHQTDDLAAIAGRPGLRVVLVSKVESGEELAPVRAALGPDVPIVALIESAAGLSRVEEIAQAPGVVRLAFGSIDFALDIGARDEPLPLLFARSQLVLASRLAGLAAPVDGVTPSIDDLSRVSTEAIAAAAMGFAAKMCVHPAQVPAVNAAFSPTDEELARAERILALDGSDAARLDGQMIDKPVIELARQTVARALRTQHRPDEDAST